MHKRHVVSQNPQQVIVFTKTNLFDLSDACSLHRALLLRKARDPSGNGRVCADLLVLQVERIDARPLTATTPGGRVYALLAVLFRERE